MGFLVLKHFTWEKPYGPKHPSSGWNRSSGLFCATSEIDKGLLEWVVLCGLHGVQLGGSAERSIVLLIKIALLSSIVLLTNIVLLSNIVLLNKVVLLRNINVLNTFVLPSNTVLLKNAVLMLGWPPNICQIECENRCQNGCRIECQIESQKKCQIECQIESRFLVVGLSLCLYLPMNINRQVILRFSSTLALKCIEVGLATENADVWIRIIHGKSMVNTA